MGAVNKKHMQTYEGILEIAPYVENLASAAYVRAASVRGLLGNIDANGETVVIRADDTKEVVDAVKIVGKITGSFLENVRADIMEMLLGGTKTDIAGSATPVTAEAHGTGWTVGQPFKLFNKNGNNTEVASIVVKKGTTTLVEGTDYEVYVGDGTNGEKGFTYIVPLTAATTAITVNYSYTPNESEEYEKTQEWAEKPHIIARITAENKDDATKKRVFLLDDCTFEGQYGLAFDDVYQNGDVKGTEFEFAGRDGSKVKFTNSDL